MKTILIIMVSLLAIGDSQTVNSPEDLYEIYDKDGKYRAAEEKFDEIIQRGREAENDRNAKMMLVLGVSTLVGLVPVVVIGSRIIKERSWETNPSGMWKAVGIALACGVALFALNFGIIYHKIIYDREFNKLFPVIIGFIIIVGTIYLLIRTKKKK